MMQAMKGATGVLGSMNRSMNLPALQRIAMEFEKENDIMDQRQEMMDDAIDDVTGLEDEAEGEEVVEQVLEEIGIDLKNAVSWQILCSLVRENTYCGDRWAKLLKVFRAKLLRKAGLRRL
jgi:division protein CdvB (Snf7/Vps24/ESCRT-III family)